MNWSEFALPRGTFTSNVFDASSIFHNYSISAVVSAVQPAGTISICELRFSEDGLNWGEWIDIVDLPMYIPDIVSTSDMKGQYRVTMATSDASFSPSFSSLTLNAEGVYQVDNIGDMPCKPEIWIKKTGSRGNVTLKNLTNNKRMILTDINANETIYLDGENELVLTDWTTQPHRYDSHNGEFLTLDVGKNILTGEGDFEFEIKMQFKLHTD